MPTEDLEQRLAKLETALTEIDTARAQLVEEIQTLRLHAVTPAHAPQAPSVTMNSKTADKLALFRSLLGGPPDVYARRWNNPKTGKSGNSPSCYNEWTKGIMTIRILLLGLFAASLVARSAIAASRDNLVGMAQKTGGAWP